MAWNPSPEVAAARDMAAKINADRVIVLYTTEDGKCGGVSYGKTKVKCGEAKKMMDGLWGKYQEVLEDEL